MLGGNNYQEQILALYLEMDHLVQDIMWNNPRVKVKGGADKVLKTMYFDPWLHFFALPLKGQLRWASMGIQIY